MLYYMPNKLSRYFSHQVKEIKAFFQKVDQSITDEDIHNLRLSVKKLRALFTLINAVVPSFKMQYALIPFELLFDQAAKVREARLQYQMIPQLPATPVTQSYRSKLKRTAEKERKSLAAQCTTKAWKELKTTSKKVEASLNKVSMKKAKDFIAKQKKKLKKKITPDPIPPNELHDVRKSIKNQQYFEKMFKLKPALAFSGALEELIGQWHDEVVLLEGLQKAKDSASLPPEERLAHLHLLRAMRERIQADLKRIYKKQQKAVKLV
jgi:CHAD domain-containing protein